MTHVALTDICAVPCLRFVSRLATLTFRFPHHHRWLNLNTLLNSVAFVGRTAAVSCFEHYKMQRAGASMAFTISHRDLTGWDFPRTSPFVLPLRATRG